LETEEETLMDADAKNLPETADPIQVVHPCCCGLDVHKREVQASPGQMMCPQTATYPWPNQDG
jgi:hypothetical protein